MSAIHHTRQHALEALQNRSLEDLEKAHAGTASSHTLLREDDVINFFAEAGTHPRDFELIEFLWDRIPSSRLLIKTSEIIRRISFENCFDNSSFRKIFARAKAYKNTAVKQWTLQSKDLYDMQVYYALEKQGERRIASLKKLQTSPHFNPEKLFSTALNQEEEGILLCTWILEEFSDRLSDAYLNETIKGLFYRTNHNAFILLLLEKTLTRLTDQTLQSVISAAARRPSLASTLIPFLLEKASHRFNQHQLKNCFSEICMWSHGGVSRELLTLVWQKAMDFPTDLPIQKTNLNRQLIDSLTEMLANPMAFSKIPSHEHIFDLISYLFEKCIETEGKLEFVNPLHLYPDEHPFATLIHTYLQEQGIGCKQETIQGSLRYTYPFRDFMQTLKPGGLYFYEQTLGKGTHPFSPFMLRWIFVKAAMEGKEGRALMHWLITHHPQQLSAMTVARASQLALRAGDQKTSSWIHKQMSSIATSSNQQADLFDIALMLKTSEDPYQASYHALGDAPSTYGWKPLDDAELTALKPVDYDPGEEDPFAGTDVVIVDDAHDAPLALNELSQSEALRFCALYALIRDGHTRLQIQKNDPAFEALALGQIRKLLTRPSGRWTLLFACRMGRNHPIFPGEFNHYWASDHHPSISLHDATQDISFLTKNDQGKIVRMSALLHTDASFLHELLHAIHKDRDPECFNSLKSTQPFLQGFTDLEEQYTIAGIDTRDPYFHSLGLFALSDNTYRFERGYPGRYDHMFI